MARLSKRRFQPNQSFQYKEGYRGLALDHSGNSGSFVAFGNGHILYARRIPAHPARARDRRGFDSSDSGPSSCLKLAVAVLSKFRHLRRLVAAKGDDILRRNKWS